MYKISVMTMTCHNACQTIFAVT